MSKKNRLLSLISCICLLLGLHPLGWTWLTWFAFLPLFLIYLDPNCKTSHLIIHALAVGFVYYAYGFYWLLYFIPLVYVFALLLTIPILPLYFFCLRLLASKLRLNSLQIVASIAIWIVLRQCYGLTPLGTIASDAPFYGPLPFLQIVSIANFAALAGLIIGLNFSVALFLTKKNKLILIWILLFISILAGIYVWGTKRTEKEASGTISMALVQDNLPVDGLWRIKHPLYIRKKYRDLALQAAVQKPDLIVFPLYSFPEDILRQPQFFLGLARETKNYILVPSQVPKIEGQTVIQSGFMNMAILYSPEGKIVGEYQAIQEPPFASSKQVKEYTNQEYKVMDSPLGKLGILLCYEDSLPFVTRKAVEAGAEVLIALSNPGFFTTTHMPYYHLLQDQLRAIESGRELVRVSTNGYTGHIDSRGKILQKSKLATEQILYAKVGRK